MSGIGVGSGAGSGLVGFDAQRRLCSSRGCDPCSGCSGPFAEVRREVELSVAPLVGKRKRQAVFA